MMFWNWDNFDRVGSDINKHKICAEVAWVEQSQTYLKEFGAFKISKDILQLFFRYHYFKCEMKNSQETEVFNEETHFCFFFVFYGAAFIGWGTTYDFIVIIFLLVNKTQGVRFSFFTTMLSTISIKYFKALFNHLFPPTKSISARSMLTTMGISP